MMYSKGNYIAHGSYGQVSEATNDAGHKVAFKEGFYTHVILGFGNAKELDILSRLSTSCLVPKLLDIIIVFEAKKRETKLRKMESVILITELCDGDLAKFIDNGHCTPQIALKLTTELLLAIEFLHSNRITHRDIKPGNVLIKNGPDGPHLKLCDFGFAHFLCNGSNSTPEISTVQYRAPEVCWGIPHYRHTSDIWSIGCTIYEMFTGAILVDIRETSNSILFDAIIERIPLVITNDIINLYQSNTRTHLSFDNKRCRDTSFMSTFSKCKDFNTLSHEKWQMVNSLLMNIFNLDYLSRKDSSECLEFPLFKDQQRYIDKIRGDNNLNKTLDTIIINNSTAIYTDKVSAFMNFLNNPEKMNKISMRTMFHAVDLANRYFLIYPENDNVNKIVLECIYYFHKYVCTMRYPEFPEFFFDAPKDKSKREQYFEDLEIWVFNFEKKLYDSVLHKWQSYRSGLYEMADEYSHRLSHNQVRAMLTVFISIKKWDGGSYRAMYRSLYRKLFDSTAFPIVPPADPVDQLNLSSMKIGRTPKRIGN